MADIGWRRRRGSSPAARRGARQRAGLMPASASNTLSCQRETLHSQQLRSIEKSIDSDHGIYRERIAGAAEGRVLDLGIGSGLNLPFYAPRARQIFGLDPSLPLRLYVLRLLRRLPDGNEGEESCPPCDPRQEPAAVQCTIRGHQSQTPRLSLQRRYLHTPSPIP